MELPHRYWTPIKHHHHTRAYHDPYMSLLHLVPFPPIFKISPFGHAGINEMYTSTQPTRSIAGANQSSILRRQQTQTDFFVNKLF